MHANVRDVFFAPPAVLCYSLKDGKCQNEYLEVLTAWLKHIESLVSKERRDDALGSKDHLPALM